MKRYVTCGDGRKVPLGVYVTAWRVVKNADPDQMFNRSLCDRWPASAGAILAQYRAGMVDRINEHLPWYGKGRKWSYDYQRHLRLDANEINYPRLVINYIRTPELIGRFSHRLREAA